MNSETLSTFKEQFKKTQKEIESNTLLLEENHEKTLKQLMDICLLYQQGKNDLYIKGVELNRLKESLKTIPEFFEVLQTENNINERVKKNKIIKSILDKTISEIKISFKKQMKTL